MKTFQISNEAKRMKCANAVSDLPTGDGYEVVIRKSQKAKTMRQLGALFGLWVKEEAERTGESEHQVHRRWKAWFLARIYISDPQTPEQESWVELLALYQQQKGMVRHIGNRTNPRGNYEVSVVDKDSGEILVTIGEKAGKLWSRLLSLMGIRTQSTGSDKLLRHARRISLSWATLPQMKQYMAAIEQHYMAEGRPLSVPDPDYDKAMKEARHDQHRQSFDRAA